MCPKRVQNTSPPPGSATSRATAARPGSVLGKESITSITSTWTTSTWDGGYQKNRCSLVLLLPPIDPTSGLPPSLPMKRRHCHHLQRHPNQRRALRRSIQIGAVSPHPTWMRSHDTMSATWCSTSMIVTPSASQNQRPTRGPAHVSSHHHLRPPS
jgi:hypothetical protein